MPKLLHESTGLKIVKNDVNRFAIASLHYSADPAKRSSEWKAEAAAGMPPEKFAREYELDYAAILGAKVFQEITNFKDAIVVPEVDFGPDTRYWAGFDYGIRNASAFLVFTVQDGILYCVHEIYHPCQNIPAFADEMRAWKYFKSIRYIASDPALWGPTPDVQGGLTSVYEIFTKSGIRQMIKGRNDGAAEEAWVAMMREHWRNPEDITYKISSACPNHVRELEKAVFVQQSDRQLLTSVYRETIADVDNHSLDAAKYLMLSRPSQQLYMAWKDPQMVNRWAVPSGKRQSSYTPQTQGRKPVGGYV